MSGLKKSLIEKLDIKPSSDFDSRFFEKLGKEKKRPRVFASWLTWAVSGCATASVLYLAITGNHPPAPAFNHREYVESAVEIQSAMTDDITIAGTVDLTTSSYDEI
jgi:hypothetical protein